MKLTFFGGAGDVTGANYMLESGGVKIMVDCGLHQGGNYDANALNLSRTIQKRSPQYS
jgi:Cft2 family RNA processing exonuclease